MTNKNKWLEEHKCQYCGISLGDVIRTDYGYAEIVCCKNPVCIISFKKEFGK